MKESQSIVHRKILPAQWHKLIVMIFISAIILVLFVARLGLNERCLIPDLDCSWVMDMQFKFQHGIIAGRDFFFTYGPLSQLIFSSSFLLDPGHTTAELIPFLDAGRDLFALLLLNICLSLLPMARWRTVLIVMFAFAFLGGMLNMRALTSVLLVIVLAHALSATSRRTRLLLGIAAGLIGFAGQLISFDVGIYSVAVSTGLVALSILFWLARRFVPHAVTPPKEVLLILCCTLGAFILANLLISIFYKLSSANYERLFDYQYYSFQMAQAYNYTMSTVWEPDLLLSIILISIVSYCVTIYVFRLRSLPSFQVYLYTGLFSLALFQLKSAFVRSDNIHIVTALLPLILLFLLLAFTFDRRYPITVPGVVLALGLVVAWPFPVRDYVSSTVVALRHPRTLLEHIQHARRLHINPADIVPEAMSAALRPDSYLVNFPHENMIAVALDRRNLTPVLQPYAAQSTLLQEMYVQRVDQVKLQTEVIYCANSSGIDGVPDITRSPLIVDYFLKEFELKTLQVYKNHCVILKPRAVPRSLPEQQLAFNQWNIADGQQVAFKQESACTLLRLHMQMDYSVLSAFGRPTPLTVRVMNNNRVLSEQRLVPIDPNRPFLTYLYLGDPLTSYTLFDSALRAMPDWAVTGLQFEQVSLGPLDVHPSRVQIMSVDCVKLSSSYTIPVQPEHDGTAGSIVPGLALQQEFVSERDKLEGISILVGTFNRKNQSKLVVSLRHANAASNDPPIATETLDAATLVDNAYVTLRFPQQASQGQHYVVTVESPDATQDQAVTVWMQSGDPYPAGNLLFNTTATQNDLTFSLVYGE